MMKSAAVVSAFIWRGKVAGVRTMWANTAWFHTNQTSGFFRNSNKPSHKPDVEYLIIT